nr:hypothetical protein [Tanacetum cinerariifolium]
CLLTHGIELAIVKCLNSPEYLYTLRVAIGKATEKGMQEGLSTGIVHGTYDTAPATADTNTTLSTTCAFSSSIDPIVVDDYEVVGAEDQAVADENAASFPNVDDAKLNIPE